MLKPARPLAAAEESWVVATDLAEALARAGTPFIRRTRSRALVLESVRAGKKPADWTPRSSRPSRRSSRRRWRAARPDEGMKTREMPGGTGPEAVAAALAEAAAAA